MQFRREVTKISAGKILVKKAFSNDDKMVENTTTTLIDSLCCINKKPLKIR